MRSFIFFRLAVVILASTVLWLNTFNCVEARNKYSLSDTIVKICQELHCPSEEDLIKFNIKGKWACDASSDRRIFDVRPSTLRRALRKAKKAAKNIFRHFNPFSDKPPSLDFDDPSKWAKRMEKLAKFVNPSLPQQGFYSPQQSYPPQQGYQQHHHHHHHHQSFSTQGSYPIQHMRNLYGNVGIWIECTPSAVIPGSIPALVRVFANKPPKDHPDPYVYPSWQGGQTAQQQLVINVNQGTYIDPAVAQTYQMSPYPPTSFPTTSNPYQQNYNQGQNYNPSQTSTHISISHNGQNNWNGQQRSWG